MSITFPTDTTETFEFGGYLYTFDADIGAWIGGNIPAPEPFMLTFPFNTATVEPAGIVQGVANTPAEDMFVINNETAGFYATAPGNPFGLSLLLVFPSSFPGFVEGTAVPFLSSTTRGGTVTGNNGLTATRATTYGTAATGDVAPWVFGPQIAGLPAGGTQFTRFTAGGVTYDIEREATSTTGNPVGTAYNPFNYTITIV